MRSPPFYGYMSDKLIMYYAEEFKMQMFNFYEEPIDLYRLVDFSDKTEAIYALTDFEARKILDYCRGVKTLVFTKLNPEEIEIMTKYVENIFI